jgi:hypothetical protein
MENELAQEALPEEIAAIAQTQPKPEEAQKCCPMKKKRDIFRFNGTEDMTIDLGHIYKIVKSGKRITFHTPFAIPNDSEKRFADYVEFENEDVAARAYDQILNVWGSDVLE